ncbi:MAG: TonB-dependent receptor [Ignavibacteriales bacterium]|nr:TonB-dependent receptor [Ignavibacteriales bacterium]
MGTIRDGESRDPIPGANVRLKGTAFGSATDEKGFFKIVNVPVGKYVVAVSFLGYKTVESSISVEEGGDHMKDFFMQQEALQAGDVVVFGASLRRERITEAPAAVSVVDAKEIIRSGGHGQLPNLLASEPGVDVVQSGLFDFNINTRGFNSTLNRRLLVLLDGRDLAIVLLGAQEWNGLSVPLEDIGRIEMVRGPGSALYGANAYNGVINISTPAPKTIPGTKVTLAGGNRNSLRTDVRYADAFSQWSYKVNLGYYTGISWSQPRPDTLPAPLFANGPFEYGGLLPPLHAEARRLNDDNVSSAYGSARVDHDFDDGSVASLEGGTAQVQNEVFVTGIGRVQVMKASKPWMRLNYTANSYNFQAWYSGRQSNEPQYSLGTGLPLYEKSSMFHLEGQYHTSLLEEALTVVVGASHRAVLIDTENPLTGKQSLIREARNDNASGVFSQLEYRWSDNLKFVAAARVDRSSLHSTQFSPKAAAVWSPVPAHALRLTFNQAFQAPNYSELFLNILHPFRNQAYFGNDKVKVEKITGYEIGYKGIFGEALFVTADFYFNMMKDFITDLAGGVNPAYPRAPTPIPGDTQFASRSILSYGNAGRVNEGGFEIAFNYYVTDELYVSGNYSQFLYEVLEKNQYDQLLPNAPDFRINAGIAYSPSDVVDLSLRGKYVPGYPWAAGIYIGEIKSYTLVDLAASVSLTSYSTLNLSVTNLFDQVHYEVFGGSLIGRRAIVTTTVSL